VEAVEVVMLHLSEVLLLRQEVPVEEEVEVEQVQWVHRDKDLLEDPVFHHSLRREVEVAQRMWVAQAH
jgi:hypothetical protein